MPSQGSGPALPVLPNRIDTPAAALRPVQDGQLRTLGLTTARPSRLVPGVRPIAAAGGPPGYDIGAWNRLMVPAGTPRPAVGRLVAEAKQGSATHRPFETPGVEVEPRGPDESVALPCEPWGTFGASINRPGTRAG